MASIPNRPPLFQALKRVRDVAADPIGRAAARWRPVEHAVVAAGRVLHARWHPFDLFYRRAVETLEARRAEAAPVFRRMRVGPVELWGEVSHFSFGTTYFHRHAYEGETVSLFARVLRPGDTVVDVGANHGYFTALAALLVGARGRVEAFEPNPAVAAALRAVLRRNGVEGRVGVHPEALSDRDGWAEFFVSVIPTNDGLSSLLASDEALAHGAIRADHTLRVPTNTFDAFAARAGLGCVSLLKIDVEGAEALVLGGMQRTLAAHPPRRIVCETPMESAAARMLLERGYSARLLDHRNTLFTAPDAE